MIRIVLAAKFYVLVYKLNIKKQYWQKYQIIQIKLHYYKYYKIVGIGRYEIGKYKIKQK